MAASSPITIERGHVAIELGKVRESKRRELRHVGEYWTCKRTHLLWVVEVVVVPVEHYLAAGCPKASIALGTDDGTVLGTPEGLVGCAVG